MLASSPAVNCPRPATTIHGSAAAAASTAASGPKPVSTSAIAPRRDQPTTRSNGTATTPTAAAYEAVSDESRPASRARASGGQHGHADGRRREGEHDEHAVRREEPVRLGGPAKLAGDDHADDGREAGLHGDPERRHGARRERPESGRGCTLPHGSEAYGQRQPTR